MITTRNELDLETLGLFDRFMSTNLPGGLSYILGKSLKRGNYYCK
jgi:hypothetical protein